MTTLATPLRKSALSFLLILVALSDQAIGHTVRLTITDAALEQQRSDITREVEVEGLEDCSTAGVKSLEVVYQTETIVFTSAGGTHLWSGTEANGMGGTARLTAIMLTSATEAEEEFIDLKRALTAEADDKSCIVNAHISTIELKRSIIVGTFADGKVWADALDWLEESAEDHEDGKGYILPDSDGDEVVGEDDGTLVQLHVPYTGEALCQEAGLTYPCDFTQTSSIIGRINFLIDETNQILSDSNTGLQIDGLQAWRTQDFEEGPSFSFILNAMRTADDGVFQTPSLLNARNDFCADIVGLIVADGYNTGSGTTLGLAYLGPSTGAYVFVSSLTSSAISGYTFAHELGHNLGCRHDRFNDPDPPAYAHGYLGSGGSYSSIMTTRATCSGSCVRYPVFSNPPPFSYIGLTMGNSVNADNVRRIEETRSFVSNLRDSAGCSSGPTPTPPTGPSPTTPTSPTPPTGQSPTTPTGPSPTPPTGPSPTTPTTPTSPTPPTGGSTPTTCFTDTVASKAWDFFGFFGF